MSGFEIGTVLSPPRYMWKPVGYLDTEQKSTHHVGMCSQVVDVAGCSQLSACEHGAPVAGSRLQSVVTSTGNSDP